MSLPILSGVPRVIHKDAGDTTPVNFSASTVGIHVNAAPGTKIYFTTDDFKADANYVTVGDSGFFAAPCRVNFLFVSGAAEVVGFLAGT